MPHINRKDSFLAGNPGRKIAPVTQKLSALRCFACGISIGPGYEETFPSKAGDKTLCGWCHSTLKKQGYIQINSLQRLLPDGTVIRFVQGVGV
ncbi:hypothetical protein ES703_38346 [subsurface metagenome]